MKKFSKGMLRCTAAVVSAVLVLTTVFVGVVSVTAAEEASQEIVYTEKMSLTGYISVEPTDGSSGATMAAQAAIAGAGTPGYGIKNSDGQMVGGSVVYGSSLPIKEIQFVTSFSDNPGFLGSAEFYASSDCETWTKITTTRTTGDRKWGGGNAHQKVYDTCAFDLDSQIRYVKIVLDKKSSFNALGIHEINYNTYDIDLIYLNEPVLSEASTEEGNTIAVGPAGNGGYLIKNADGQMVSGSMIFYDENGISDYCAEYAHVGNSYWGEVKIYISKDGETWENAPGTDNTLDKWYSGDKNCKYHTFYGTVLPKWGYKYLKVSIVKDSSLATLNRPVVFSVKYNNAAQIGTGNPQTENPTMKDRYEVRTSADKATAIQAENYPLTNVYGVGDNLKYNVYTFWDMDAWKSGDKANAWKPGISNTAVKSR